MRLKLIRARTMPEAIARIRAELGEEALILGSRRVAEGVEITAAIEPETPSEPAGGTPAHDQPPPCTPRNLATRAAALAYGALPWDRPLMLVGPPGAGKTTTVAKLATRLVLDGDTPLVLTADGSRAGAVAQLAGVAALLDLDLCIADNPLALARCLAGRPAGQKVIIDTAGVDPFDATACEALLTLAVTADAALALVLQAGLDTEESAELAAAFAAIGTRHLIATRIDCVRRLGGIIAAAEAGPLTLAEAGIGPGIADGLTPLSAAFLTNRLTRPPISRSDRAA